MAQSKANTRSIKPKPYRSLRLQQRVKHDTKPLPSAYQIAREALRLLGSEWKLFAGLLGVYLMLNIILIGGFGLGANVQTLKTDAEASGQTGLSVSLSTFGSLLSGGSTASGSQQLILIFIFSLAIMWALRQTQAKEKTSVKHSLYRGMYPLIPFLLVLSVIMLQLLPLLAGNFVYSIVVNGGIAVEAVEKVLWALLSGLFILLSLYMVSSSIFAMYIVTLPNMEPLPALRSAREIVRYRRFMVMRKVLALPLLLVLLMGVIVVPLIMIAPPVAEVVAYILSTAILLLVHSYLYTLYRKLL